MASKNERELKVCALSGHNYKPVPSIRLMGQWLEAAGFHIGDPVLVRCEDGRLIISLDTERAELIEAEKAFMEKETRKLHERFLKDDIHNELVSGNPSQKLSVEQAYKEKNIFFIQGPPGTGKTTVIRELVEQVLESDGDSRVLIVSQANVAVDTALSGLVEKYGDQTVRCGNGNKISAKFQEMRLQNRCQDYIDEHEERKDSFAEEFYDNWKDTLTASESFEYSPVLCELIIRSHRLIGATCVGLARRNIGLERTEFDLVIIDEAGKALPAEMLIPLVRAKKAVIIGDQRQLPPVINPILYDEEKIDLEERAISENDLFCHSFFERLYDNAPDSCKVMLDTQFRMPSVIGTGKISPRCFSRILNA